MVVIRSGHLEATKICCLMCIWSFTSKVDFHYIFWIRGRGALGSGQNLGSLGSGRVNIFWPEVSDPRKITVKLHQTSRKPELVNARISLKRWVLDCSRTSCFDQNKGKALNGPGKIFRKQHQNHIFQKMWENQHCHILNRTEPLLRHFDDTYLI